MTGEGTAKNLSGAARQWFCCPCWKECRRGLFQRGEVLLGNRPYVASWRGSASFGVRVRTCPCSLSMLPGGQAFLSGIGFLHDKRSMAESSISTQLEEYTMRRNSLPTRNGGIRTRKVLDMDGMRTQATFGLQKVLDMVGCASVVRLIWTNLITCWCLELVMIF